MSELIDQNPTGLLSCPEQCKLLRGIKALKLGSTSQETNNLDINQLKIGW